MSARNTRWTSGWLLVLLAACCSWVMAAEPSPKQQEADKVLAGVRAALVKGPATVERMEPIPIPPSTSTPTCWGVRVISPSTW